MQVETPNLVTVAIGALKIQIPVSNTLELFDFFHEQLKVNPKLITLSVNGVLISESTAQELCKEDSIALEVLDSKIGVNVKDGLDLEKTRITELMLKKFTDYRILKSKYENLQIEKERKLSEIAKRENARKESGYFGSNYINQYMRKFQNCSKEEQLTERHAYERMIFEAEQDERKKQEFNGFGHPYQSQLNNQLSCVKSSIEDMLKMMQILNQVIENQ